MTWFRDTRHGSLTGSHAQITHMMWRQSVHVIQKSGMQDSWGSCRWGIDAGGTLWITPAAGRTEGTAQSLPKGETWIEPSYGKGAPWRSQSKGIRSVKVLGTVRLVGCANCMFEIGRAHV